MAKTPLGFDIIEGLIDAPFTPMKPNGDLNLDVVPAYCDMLVRAGMRGVLLNGSSGEGLLLTVEERKAVVEAWMAAAPAGFRVLVHCCHTSTRTAAELAAHVEAVGASGIASMATPFPKAGSAADLVRYCKEVAAAAPSLPFYYYHIPALSGVSLPMVPLLEAVDGVIPNFAGIKYTYEALYEENQCALYGGGKYQILHG